MPDYYGSLEEADAYHMARGNAAWADAPSSPPDAKLAALLRASVWLDGTYGTRFAGTRTDGRSQARAWPRTDAYDTEGFDIGDDEIPLEILHATYEAALRELSAPGSLSPDYVPSEGIKSETVGPISVTYRDGADVRPIATVIDDILAPLLTAKPGSTRTQWLMRA